MATVSAVAAVVGAVATVGGAVVSNRRQKKAQKEQKRQNEISNRLARAQTARDVRRQVAENRIRTAQVQQAGFAFGVEGSTAVQQATGAGITDQATSIGATQSALNVSELIAQSQNNIANIQSQSNPFTTIGAVAGAASNAQTNRAVASLV